MRRDDEVHTTTDNIFADLGLPDADELIKKAPLALAITRAIREKGLTQADAAERMGLEEPDVNSIVRGHLEGFSLGRLVDCLNALDRDVELTIRDKDPRAPRGRFSVTELGRPAIA